MEAEHVTFYATGDSIAEPSGAYCRFEVIEMLKKFCLYSGCKALVENGYCEKHTKSKQVYDQYRGSSTERGYDARWRRYRVSFLKEHPLCAQCLKENKVTPATVVDHIKDHKGDYDLFWDTDNHQPLCKRHHDRKTAQTNPMNRGRGV